VAEFLLVKSTRSNHGIDAVKNKRQYGRLKGYSMIFFVFNTLYTILSPTTSELRLLRKNQGMPKKGGQS
jgi:hypothetical protein